MSWATQGCECLDVPKTCEGNIGILGPTKARRPCRGHGPTIRRHGTQKTCQLLLTRNGKKKSRKSVEKYGKATKSISLLSEKWFQTCSNNGYPLDFRYFNDMSSKSSILFHSYLLPITILYMHIRFCRSKVFAPWAQSSTTRSPKSLASLMMWSALCMLPNKWEMTTWASEQFTPRIPKGRDSNVKFLSAGPTHPGH